MSLPIFAVGVVAYLFGKNKSDAISPDTGGRGEEELTCVYPQIRMLRQGSTTEYVCGLDPEYNPPQAEENQFADMDEITWDAVYVTEGTADNPDRYVWKHGVLMGLLYDNGTDDRHYEYHYIIGNESHTTFVRDSDGTFGHLFNGMAKVYPDEDSAIIEANRLNAPDDGVQPQPDDNDDGDTGGSSPPLQPSTGLGGNNTTFNVNDETIPFNVVDRFNNDYSDYFGGI